MNFKSTFTTAAMLLLMSGTAFAQKIKWQKGDDLAFIKGQTAIATEYDYSQISVKGESEQSYIDAQRADLNKEKAGDGDVFAAEWTEARARKYQPQFEKGFNKMLEKDGISIKNDGSAKYTILLSTGDMEMGKGKMFVKQPALVTYQFRIVETANKDNVVAKGTIEEVEGEIDAPKGSRWMGSAGTVMAVTANSMNRDYSNRIGNAYNKAGAAIGKAIHKTM